MATQICVETISPITYKNIAVVTTELLADLYGTIAHSITKNHRANASRFAEGKHYFKIQDDELRAFKWLC
ncbi:ORF6N domain-containing protein [Symbiopectobacterium purcellii]|uniref:ORF6N domain-containing protein n=1 Tax=Symbiopectobacterium purcellii TaxID=2871826 RepID=UPI003F8729EC